MKNVFVFLMSTALMTGMFGCAKSFDPSTYEFESPEHKILYDLIVERCDAINDRDTERLKNIYAKESAEYDWLVSEWVPEYQRRGIFHTVVDVKKISIVEVDAVGTYVIRLAGQYGRRSPLGTVDVLYVKEDTEWKIVSVAEY
ncbi:MAG: hypothetical protein JSV83_12045 [Desulfobacterales bacterium]|nr:MAG: hypothetical protein JSV83_12045 [Desulfobacterales bacterium]